MVVVVITFPPKRQTTRAVNADLTRQRLHENAGESICNFLVVIISFHSGICGDRALPQLLAFTTRCPKKGPVVSGEKNGEGTVKVARAGHVPASSLRSSPVEPAFDAARVSVLAG
jgi:hypothetical protein